jgi:endogenous inhibitor of DNA gyrase (YacG/DUF329 family)
MNPGIGAAATVLSSKPMAHRSSLARIVSCPHCGNSVEWLPENRYRPFCSERCRLIDLGAWATERYRVPVVEEKDDPEQSLPDEAKRL